MNKKIIILGILVIVLALVIGFGGDKVEEKKDFNVFQWKTFQSESYNFELKYPASDWNMAEAPDDELAPKYSFYIKPAGVPVTAPFDHFANISNVSVFPKGIPTENLLGERKDINKGWGENISDESKLYILKNGTPFVAYLKFKEVPKSWNDSGFAWIRLRLNNFESVCYKNGEKVGEEECNPLGLMEEYEIEYKGDIVNKDFWQRAKEVVKTISFDVSTSTVEG